MSLYQLDWSEEPEAAPDLAWDWTTAVASTVVTARAVDGATAACSQRALSRAANRRILAMRARHRAGRTLRVSHRAVSERAVHSCVAARPPPREVSATARRAC